MWELFWKRVVFWFKGCSHHFCPKKRYGSKVFHLCQQEKGLWFKGLLIPFLLAREGYGSMDSREMGNFRSTCHKASIKVISEYHGFGTCFFFHDLFTPGNDACHRWPSKLKHHFSCEDYFERVGFWFEGCSRHFCLKKGMAKKCSTNVSKKRGYGSKDCWYHFC